MRIEPGVRVHPVAAEVVVAAPLELVRPRARDELDLHRALAGHVGPLRRRRHGDFLDRVQPRVDAGEHPVPRLCIVVLDVHAVERDVDRALRQAVDLRVAEAAGARRDAGNVVHQVERRASGQRNIRNLSGGQGRRHRRLLRLHDFGRAADDNGFSHSAELQLRVDVGGNADADDDVLQDDCLEPFEVHRRGIRAGGNRRDRERAIRAAHRGEQRARRVVLDGDVGTRHDGAGGIGDRPGQGRCRAALRGGDPAADEQQRRRDDHESSQFVLHETLPRMPSRVTSKPCRREPQISRGRAPVWTGRRQRTNRVRGRRREAIGVE